MKTALIAATALSLLAAPAAFAQVPASASSTVNLGGTVDELCGVGNHASGASVDPDWAQGDISGIDIVDGNGQFVPYISGQRSFGNMWCNTAATVALSVSSFSNGNSAPADAGSFANSFNVKVTTDTSVYFNANTPGGVVTSNGATAGTASGNTNGAFETGLRRYSGMIIEILPEGNKRPEAGTYSAAITLTATAL